MNLAVMPMHWSGLLGMPRRTWVYDAGQGLEIWNLMSSYGAFLQVLAGVIGFWNLWRSRNGEKASANPWGAATLEWAIPSPPPDYNFATIPTVTSRYPLWDGGLKPVEGPSKSAKELGIPMPNPTIKPLFAALWMTLMFASLLLLHKDMHTAGITGIIVFALLMTFTLYSWLLTPLEDEH